MYDDDFRKRLVELRMEKNVSARDMSLTLGQNPGYINNIESGKSLPSLTGFFYICEYFGVSPSDFFNTDLPRPNKVNDFVSKLSKLDSTQFNCIYTLVEELVKKRSH